MTNYLYMPRGVSNICYTKTNSGDGLHGMLTKQIFEQKSVYVTLIKYATGDLSFVEIRLHVTSPLYSLNEMRLRCHITSEPGH